MKSPAPLVSTPSTPKPPSSPPVSARLSAQTAKNPDVVIPKVINGKREKKLKIGIYGSGGVGKTTFAAGIKQIGIEPLFIDLDRGSYSLDVARIDAPDWNTIMAILKSEETMADYGAIIIDSLSRAEDMAIEWTLKNVPTDKKQFVSNINQYGWAEGYRYVYDTFQSFLTLCEKVTEKRHIIMVAHDCVERVANAAGADYLQNQPRLQNVSKGNIRARFHEYCDHLVWMEIERAVSDAGKAAGAGVRFAHTAELPHAWAKSKYVEMNYVEIPKDDGSFWNTLINFNGGE